MASKKKPGGRRKPRAGLTAQEQRFCEHYALNKNGAEAVGATWQHTRKWRPQTRAEKAAKLIVRNKIATRIAELEAITKTKLDSAYGMTARDVVHRLSLLANGTVKNFVRVDAEGGRPSRLPTPPMMRCMCSARS
jgi:hypothetical protein